MSKKNAFRFKLPKSKRFNFIVLVLVALLVAAFLALFKYYSSASTPITIANPYKNYDYNYKGSLHTHSSASFDVSSGGSSGAQIANWYKKKGFGFYVISDHNKVTSVGSVSGIARLGGSEEKTINPKNSSDNHGDSHMGLVNISSNPKGSAAAVIKTVKSSGGITILNHPGQYNPAADRRTLTVSGLTGMEVYNGLRPGPSQTYASAFWDAALLKGAKIWGFSSDDAHLNSDRGRGFNVVNSSNSIPNSTDIIKNIKAGNFYASTPVDPNHGNYKAYDLTVRVDGSTITASTTNGGLVRFIANGKNVKTVSGKSGIYTPVYKAGVNYVRIEILNSKKKIVAWSQPLYITAVGPVAPVAPAPAPTYKVISTAEVAKHNKATDCWFIVNKKVYNITSYISGKKHPGGQGYLVNNCGKNATNAYVTTPHKHSAAADKLLAKYFYINLNGRVKIPTVSKPTPTNPAPTPPVDPVVPTPDPDPKPTPPVVPAPVAKKPKSSTTSQTSPAKTAPIPVSVPVEDKDIESPSVPAGVKTEYVKDQNQVNVSWDVSTDNKAVLGYEIQRQLEGGSTWDPVGNVSGSTFSDFLFESNKSYDYQVRAYDEAKNFSGWSTSSLVMAGTFVANVTESKSAVVVDDQKEVTIELPAGSVTQDAFVTISKNSIKDPGLPLKYYPVGPYFEFKAKNAKGEDITNFNKQITIRFNYNKLKLAGYKKDSIKIVYSSDGGSTFQSLPTQLKDGEAVTLSNHFSIYTLSAEKTFWGLYLWPIVFSVMILAAAVGGFFGWRRYQVSRFKSEHAEDFIFRH
jgi:cytochrome b involved in lipid metabolism